MKVSDGKPQGDNPDIPLTSNQPTNIAAKSPATGIQPTNMAAENPTTSNQPTATAVETPQTGNQPANKPKLSASKSWPVGDSDGFLPLLLEELRRVGLVGTTARKYGGADELLLVSGGPVRGDSRFTSLVGPPTLRFVQVQPLTQEVAHPRENCSPLHGEIDLSGGGTECEWLIQKWGGQAWETDGVVTSPDLGGALREISSHTRSTGDQSIAQGEHPQPGALGGLLAYDLVQWTEPARLTNLPSEGALNGILLRCDRWVTHDRQQGVVTLCSMDHDEWFIRTSEVLDESLKLVDELVSQSDVTSFSSPVNDRQHVEIVEQVRDGIRRGEFYQLNYGRVWEGGLNSPWKMFRRLLESNPAPYSGWLSVPDYQFALASASPELLLAKRGKELSTRPIKGTRPRARVRERDESLKRELAASSKEVSEHMMLVDLERNDLAKVCSVGTVRWHDWRIESHPTVHHLVSDVRGRLKEDLDEWDALQALFPGGSITGCPKTATVAAIDEVEGRPRRAWTGSLGVSNPQTGRSTWNILIRTLEAEKNRDGEWQAKIQAGGGLVYESKADEEVAEAKWKAQALLNAAGGISETSVPVGEMTISSIPDVNERTSALLKILRDGVTSCIAPREPIHWYPSDPPLERCHPDTKRLLFIDNLDSFSYNIVHSAARSGAEVVIVEGRGREVVTDVQAVLNATRPTHILIGPGPGRPANSPLTEKLAKSAVNGNLTDSQGSPIPLLGVCLGHQALAEAAGWLLHPSPLGPVHGVPDLVTLCDDPLFQGLPRQVRMMRYHSLVVREDNENLVVIARDSSSSTLTMGLTHPTLPLWGVQFHPESCGSVDGERIITNFLSHSMRLNGQSVEEPMLGRQG